MSQGQLIEPQPLSYWIVYRDELIVAEVNSRKDADGVIREQSRRYPSASFRAQFRGKPISHLESGGKPRL